MAVRENRRKKQGNRKERRKTKHERENRKRRSTQLPVRAQQEVTRKKVICRERRKKAEHVQQTVQLVASRCTRITI